MSGWDSYVLLYATGRGSACFIEINWLVIIVSCDWVELVDIGSMYLKDAENSWRVGAYDWATYVSSEGLLLVDKGEMWCDWRIY